MRPAIFSILFLFCTSAAAQSTRPAYDAEIKLNSIRVWEPLKPMTNSSVVSDPNTPVEDVRLKATYVDGLGRAIQNVLRGSSPIVNGGGKGDVISSIVFNETGVPEYVYVPYASNDATGNFRIDPFNEQASFLSAVFPEEQMYYSHALIEKSSLGRVLKSLPEGTSWVGSNRGTSFQYKVNTTFDEVRIWSIDNIENSLPFSNSSYPAGTLAKNIIIDEEGKRKVEFYNTRGKLVLRKEELASNTDGHDGWLCTYYVYDVYDRIRFIISPAATEQLLGDWSFSNKQQVAQELCFSYYYDDLNRLVAKKLPGTHAVELVYDNRDRLVFSRDGNMKNDHKWLVTFYDDSNRPIMTAYYLSDEDRTTLQQSMNAAAGTQVITNTVAATGEHDLIVPLKKAGVGEYHARNSITFSDGFESLSGDEFETFLEPQFGNTNVTIVATNVKPNINQASIVPLNYIYYDNYNWQGSQSFISSYGAVLVVGNGSSPEDFAVGNSTLGLITGTKKRITMPDGGEQWITQTMHYDRKSRVIQTHSENFTGGMDVYSMRYDFKGEVLANYIHHHNPQSLLTPETRLLTVNEYDHAGRLTRIKKRLNDGAEKTIVTNNYNFMNLISQKILGNNFQTEIFDYNLRGWLLGMNRGYLGSGAGAEARFAFELAYDKALSVIPGSSYAVPRYNSSLAGLTWRSFSDGVNRKYDFSYDATNRLMKADFLQLVNGTWSNTSIDFSVQMGDGLHPNTAYDPNGNIRQMKQRGLRGATVATIDDLRYEYVNEYSNKLLYVRDLENIPNGTMMDFKEPSDNSNANINNNFPDYAYDFNGNLKHDKNKEISNIRYNKDNLPEVIDLGDKGTISYFYDADGMKLRKITLDRSQNPAKSTITDYIGVFTYEDGVLQSIGHEEGRIRTVYRNGEPISYEYDYFIKDHLTNIRMVLTEQTNFNTYMATMETENGAKENATFSNIDNTRSAKPVGYPEDRMTNKNDFVAKLNAKDGGQKIGPSIVLKVTAGDTVQLYARAFYKSIGPKEKGKPFTPASEMIEAMVQSFGGEQAAVKGSSGGSITPNSDFYRNVYNRLKEKASGNGFTGNPRAFLNYVLFDNQFNMVEENSGVIGVKNEPDVLQTLAKDKMVMSRTGYLYVYSSNETQQDVYFDNVVLALAPGPLMEETHYYPFGLTMEGISDKVLSSKYYENNIKFTSQSLDRDLNLNYYQFRYRTMDPQIGRFLQVDPIGDKYAHNSTYAYAENKVTIGIDQEGLELLPLNTGWFRHSSTASTSKYYPGVTFWNSQVDIASSNVPNVFKDLGGNLLFTAASVNVGENGRVWDPESRTTSFHPGHNLPKIPDWAWSSSDIEPTTSTAGGEIGKEPDAGGRIPNAGGALAGAAQEGHAWISTYRDRKPTWDAYDKLNANQRAWYKAVDNVNSNWHLILKHAGFQTLTPFIKSAIINFVYDGTLPPLVQGDLFNSLRNRGIVMGYGIYLMEQTNISIEKSLIDARDANLKQIQTMINASKPVFNFTNFFK